MNTISEKINELTEEHLKKALEKKGMFIMTHAEFVYVLEKIVSVKNHELNNEKIYYLDSVPILSVKFQEMDIINNGTSIMIAQKIKFELL